LKKRADIEEFEQPVPINRKMVDLEGGRIYTTGVRYTTFEEFVELQAELENRLAVQTTLLAAALTELQQIKIHLSSMSDAEVEPGDGKD